jgi:hypothetical protein
LNPLLEDLSSRNYIPDREQLCLNFAEEAPAPSQKTELAGLRLFKGDGLFFPNNPNQLLK